jgi:hypothetical protein
MHGSGAKNVGGESFQVHVRGIERLGDPGPDDGRRRDRHARWDAAARPDRPGASFSRATPAASATCWAVRRAPWATAWCWVRRGAGSDARPGPHAAAWGHVRVVRRGPVSDGGDGGARAAGDPRSRGPGRGEAFAGNNIERLRRVLDVRVGERVALEAGVGNYDPAARTCSSLCRRSAIDADQSGSSASSTQSSYNPDSALVTRSTALSAGRASFADSAAGCSPPMLGRQREASQRADPTQPQRLRLRQSPPRLLALRDVRLLRQPLRGHPLPQSRRFVRVRPPSPSVRRYRRRRPPQAPMAQDYAAAPPGGALLPSPDREHVRGAGRCRDGRFAQVGDGAGLAAPFATNAALHGRRRQRSSG